MLNKYSVKQMIKINSQEQSFEPTETGINNLLLERGTQNIQLRNLNPPKVRNGMRITMKNITSHILENTIR